jgi:signal transduction histidine kinase
MTVARRLQSAFVAFVVLIAVVVAFQVRTIRGAARSGHALAEISSRLRVTSRDQLDRIAQMRDDAEKFLVTRDVAYLDRASGSATVFGRELARLNSLPLTPGERSALVRLAVDWRTIEPMVARLAATASSPADMEPSVRRFQAELDRVAGETRDLGAASQTAMSEELAAVETAASGAERISLIAAIAALMLMILLSAQLVRSIVGPLGRLAEGTRQVSAGRFDHRLDTAGDDELAQVARDFNSMTGRLDELDRLKREFVAKVSHDLKTPLTSMQETATALLDGVAGPLSDKQRHLLTLNLESNQRLAAMLSKLLDLSHLEAGLEPKRQPVDMHSLLASAVDRLASSPSPNGPRVSLLAPDRSPVVSGDPHALAQVMDNLIENALKFSPPGGAVEIRVANWSSAQAMIPAERAAAFRWRGFPDGAVLVSVADEGPGIPDAEKERVFARFYQTETGRAIRGRGAGLGLAICREIVGAHAGIVWVDDNEPRGSVFSVLLPCGASPVESHEAPDARFTHVAASVGATGPGQR